MSEFTHACPVCRQHLKCPTALAGTVMKCPTCCQRIVAPQAPSSSDGNLVFMGHRYVERKTTSLPATPPTESSPPDDSAVDAASDKKTPVGLIVTITLLVVVLAGAAWLFTSGTLTPEKPPLKHGAAGVGSWETAVEYDNFVITKGTKVLYKSNFSSNMTGWQLGKGTWNTVDGFLRQTETPPWVDCRALIGKTNWGDYTISVRARKLSGKEGFLILFNATDNDNYTWWNVGGWANTVHGIQNSVSGQKIATLGSRVNGKINAGEWYNLRVELSGLRIRCYLNNELINDVSYPDPKP